MNHVLGRGSTARKAFFFEKKNQKTLIEGMGEAIGQALEARRRDEVPVGAVVIDADNNIIGRAGNRTNANCDASAHAELLAMREAAASRKRPWLEDCDLVVTLEPCPLCAAAAALFRVRRVIFGAYDPKGGGIEHGPRIFQAPGVLHRPQTIGGVREAECAALLTEFFAQRRPLRSPATPP